MKKQIIIVTILMLYCGKLYSQSNYQLTQFQKQYAMINPGYTGINDYLDLKISYRNKWAGIENSPVNSLISVNSPLNNKTSYNQAPIRTSNPNQKQWIEDQKARLKFHGIGGQINYNTQGAYKNMNVMANYAYHIPISGRVKFSLGASIGIESFKIDVTNVSVWDPDNDQLYQSILNAGNNLNYLIVKMGGTIYSDQFHFGISYTPIVEQKLGSGNEQMLRASRFDFVGGSKLKIGPKNILSTQLWVKLSESNTFFATGIIGMHFGKSIWVGGGYSTNQNILLGLDFFVQHRLAIGYAFESKGLNDSNLGRLTHEVTLSFMLVNYLKSKPTLW